MDAALPVLGMGVGEPQALLEVARLGSHVLLSERAGRDGESYQPPSPPERAPVSGLQVVRQADRTIRRAVETDHAGVAVL